MVVGSIVQGVTGTKAADAQADSADYGADVQRRNFQDGLALIQPQVSAGNTARNALMYETGLGSQPSGYEGFQATPGYEFVRNEGLRGIERSAAARGMTQSGAQLKALNRFNSGLASQEYGNHYNRLAGIAGAGQTASQTSAGLYRDQGNALANLAIQGGNARASGYASIGGAYNSMRQDALQVAGMFI